LPSPIFVEDRLRSAQFLNPQLNLLHEDEALASIALLQPGGDAIANDHRIGPRDQALAAAKVLAFLRQAVERQVNLAITPEYFSPWDIITSIGNALQPPAGSLWAICFESIKPTELQARIAANPQLEWLCNVPQVAGEKELLNTLVYFFQATKADGSVTRTIALPQFKSTPMSDTVLQLERRRLIVGADEVFLFRNRANSIHLASIICSDALNFDPTVFFNQWGHMPHVLLHPQFNSNPIYDQFRDYRTRWSKQVGDKKHIIALNWARGSTINQASTNIEHYGRSCFYTKDSLIYGLNQHRDNHDNGLYYTVGTDRVHSCYLNFDEHSFEISISKAGRAGNAAALVNPAAPRIQSYSWGANTWNRVTPLNDGYLSNCPWRKAPIPAALVGSNLHQIEKEIVMNQATGHEGGNEKELSQVTSVNLSAGEIIRRLTFTQDQSEEARTFREAIAAKFNELCILLSNANNYPSNLSYCTDAPKLGIYAFGHNLKGSKSETAQIVYVGVVPENEAQRAYTKLHASVHPNDRRKICLWFKVGNDFLKLFEKDTSFGNPLDTNLTDLTRP